MEHMPLSSYFRVRPQGRKFKFCPVLVCNYSVQLSRGSDDGLLNTYVLSWDP